MITILTQPSYNSYSCYSFFKIFQYSSKLSNGIFQFLDVVRFVYVYRRFEILPQKVVAYGRINQVSEAANGYRQNGRCVGETCFI